MDKLVLFDLDETLVKDGGEHRASFSIAIKKAYNIDTTIDVIDHIGMSDQKIIIEVLKKYGLDEKAIKSGLEECMKFMADYFISTIDKNEIIVLEGVPHLLERLRSENIPVGLVTGNLEPIAYAKLKKTGLEQYFSAGAFGSDDVNRANLVKLAIRRAEEIFGFHPDNSVFYLGDTPRDIKAGKEAGVKTVGVASGKHSEEQLKEAGADFVLKNLKDTNKVLEIIM